MSPEAIESVRATRFTICILHPLLSESNMEETSCFSDFSFGFWFSTLYGNVNGWVMDFFYILIT